MEMAETTEAMIMEAAHQEAMAKAVEVMTLAMETMALAMEIMALAMEIMATAMAQRAETAIILPSK